jgi:hypothetical protein
MSERLSYAEHFALFEQQQQYRRRRQLQLGGRAIEDHPAAPAPADEPTTIQEQPPLEISAEEPAAPSPDEFRGTAAWAPPRADEQQPAAAEIPADESQVQTGKLTRQVPTAGENETAFAKTTETSGGPPVDTTVRVRLRVVSGPDTGQVFALPEGDFTLGRLGTDLRLSDDTVSHRHAGIEVRSRRTTIEDLGSKNGTRLNNTNLRGKMIMNPGDRLFCGETELLVEAGDQRE